MSKSRKLSRIISVIFALSLLIVMAVPSFAAWSADGSTHVAAPWNGALYAGSVQTLAYNGRGQNLYTKTINSGATPFWQLVRAPHGSGYILRNGASSTNDCVNIYWVKVGGVYYNATLYFYDYSNNGQDQRLLVQNYSDGTRFQLEQSRNSSTWYLQTDMSAPSSKSDVVWYTVNSGPRARWGCIL